MKRALLAALGIASLAGYATANASETTYYVDFNIADATITGQIVTDCNACTLAPSDILSWTFSDSLSDSTISSSTGGTLDGTGPLPIVASSNALTLTLLTSNSNDLSATFFSEGTGSFPYLEFNTYTPSTYRDIAVAGPNDAYLYDIEPTSDFQFATTTAPVPLPSTLWLLMGGLGLLSLTQRRRAHVSGMNLGIA
jgi:hypothetical protein